MSEPQMMIELDPGPWGDDPQWKAFRLAGDRVSGRVYLRLTEPLNCRGVIIAVGWNTEGKGDVDRENILETTVAQGTLEAGEHVFPFEAPLPVGPMSYTGHHIRIVWKVIVRLDLAWRRDPTSEAVFLVTLPEPKPV